MLLLALIGAFAFVAPGSAWATTGHKFADQFGGFGEGDGQFFEYSGGPVGVAVMPSTGEVFTLEQRAGRIQRFDAAGVFQSAFGFEAPYGFASSIAVDPAGFGAVYVLMNRLYPDEVNRGAVAKYSAAGVLAYEVDASSSGTTLNTPYDGPMPLAVDPADGTVYATATHDDGRKVIDRFDGSTGAFIDSFDGSSGSPDGGFQCPTGLAVDSSHRVYVLDSCKRRVDRYGADGAFGATVYDGSAPAPDGSSRAPTAVAVAPVSDEVFVAAPGRAGSQVMHYTAGGADQVNTFDSNAGGVRALAVSGAGTVYASDATEPFVQRFTPFDGPTVVTGSLPSSVGARSAVLEGTIDPEGVESTYHFEYGTDLTYGSRTVGDVAAGSGSDPVPASALATGLQPNKTYHYRIVGSNASGSIVGADQTFTTATAPPTVDGVAPFTTAITPRTTRVHGSVNPNNNSVIRWYVEYGTTAAYGSTASAPFFGDFIFGGGGSDLSVTLRLEGLEPGTLYHFRVVAVDDPFGAATPQPGVDQTFITSPAAGGGASGVTTRRATLTGTINPHGQDTTYHFNYGPTTSYGASTPEVDAGSSDGERVVSHLISGLSPDTIYHVQVVATDANGVVRSGGDGLFRTAPAPSAVAISPIGISTSAATLVGNLDTHGLPGSYRFDVSSLDSSYSVSTAERPVAGNDGVERVSVPVDGLPAGESFVVQLRVTSNDSTDVSDPVTFATASVPRVFPPPPSGDGAGSYGCAAPRLESYDSKPKPGETITISGRDLGAGGTATLGDRSTVPADWSAGGFKLEIPQDATGALGLTVNCGQRSNTIAIAIFKRPSSRFSIANATVRGVKATLSVRVAGPGKLTSSAAETRPGQVTIRKARGARLVVKLNRAGIRALRKSRTGRLKVPIRVRYLPAGGRAATKTVTVTFKHTTER